MWHGQRGVCLTLASHKIWLVCPLCLNADREEVLVQWWPSPKLVFSDNLMTWNYYFAKRKSSGCSLFNWEVTYFCIGNVICTISQLKQHNKAISYNSYISGHLSGSLSRPSAIHKFQSLIIPWICGIQVPRNISVSRFRAYFLSTICHRSASRSLWGCYRGHRWYKG